MRKIVFRYIVRKASIRRIQMTLLSTFCGLLLLVQASATGTVSGRITDEQGQPAVDVPVQLVRVAFNPQGKMFQAAGSTNVDDRGDYRLSESHRAAIICSLAILRDPSGGRGGRTAFRQPCM